MLKGDRRARVEAARSELCARLRSRRSEIESAVITRVYAVGDPADGTDPDYVTGLRACLASAVDYALQSIELGERRSPPLPPALPIQAREAARRDVGLDTVLRRYFAGYAQLAEFLLQEFEAGPPATVSLHDLLRGQVAVFDRVIAAVSAEYVHESATRSRTSEQERNERICRLLAGEPIDSSDLEYELDGWHVAAVASGSGAIEQLRQLAAVLDKVLLVLRREDGTIWAWLGSRRAVDAGEVGDYLSSAWTDDMPLAIGEPARGTAGWRLSHRQAVAAFPLARSRPGFIRYADVALLVSTLQDDLLAASLHQLYLAPLEGGRTGGTVLRETLRAYFAAGRNASSASAALGVSRQTVRKRLRTIESRLGRYLDSCTAEIEAALRLDELNEIRPVARDRS